MPCLFAVLGAFFPRIALLFLLFFTDVFSRVFEGWFFPLIGIIFLPFTTLMYVFIAYPMGSITIWGWFMVFTGLLLDIMQIVAGYYNRNNASQWSQASY